MHGRVPSQYVPPGPVWKLDCSPSIIDTEFGEVQLKPLVNPIADGESIKCIIAPIGFPVRLAQEQAYGD